MSTTILYYIDTLGDFLTNTLLIVLFCNKCFIMQYLIWVASLGLSWSLIPTYHSRQATLHITFATYRFLPYPVASPSGFPYRLPTKTGLNDIMGRDHMPLWSPKISFTSASTQDWASQANTKGFIDMLFNDFLLSSS